MTAIIAGVFFLVAIYALARCEAAYLDRERAHQRADAWETKARQLETLVRQQERDLTIERCKVCPVCAQTEAVVQAPPPPLVVVGECNGHRYFVRFSPEFATAALLMLQKWYEIAELGLCKEHVLAMQESIVLGANTMGENREKP